MTTPCIITAIILCTLAAIAVIVAIRFKRDRRVW
jgi:hypothetical protein